MFSTFSHAIWPREMHARWQLHMAGVQYHGNAVDPVPPAVPARPSGTPQPSRRQSPRSTSRLQGINVHAIQYSGISGISGIIAGWGSTPSLEQNATHSYLLMIRHNPSNCSALKLPLTLLLVPGHAVGQVHLLRPHHLHQCAAWEHESVRVSACRCVLGRAGRCTSSGRITSTSVLRRSGVERVYVHVCVCRCV